jgi:hypothetical protein
MDNPLATYLHDHLAGSEFAIDLLQSLRDHYAGEPLGELAAALIIEVQRDRETLQLIADQVGKGSPNLKEAAAWVAEKASRLKLTHEDKMGLGTFQALETLALGMQGRLALWRALRVVSGDSRLQSVNFDELISRAQNQYEQVEKSRLALASAIF